MDIGATPSSCQIANLPQIYEAFAQVPPESFARRLRLVARRSLQARQVRALKMKSSQALGWFFDLIEGSNRLAVPDAAVPNPLFRPGDLVRVRSREEIAATLNPWGQLRGCMFMPEMARYCGTTQQVFKPLERFVDERDYRVKRSHGVVLLAGLHCEGTSDYGRCDRSCFYFWREEWLEKLDVDFGAAA
jgi:hypothetical protein